MSLFNLLLPLFLLSAAEAQMERTMRVITWNVADNKYMNGGFNDTAVRQVLGLERIGEQKLVTYFDIYAITLQENCHLCDSDKFSKLANIFVSALNKEGRFLYEEVGHAATRVSSSCQSVSCVFGMHGSTHMFVIAKRGMASGRASFHTNKCMSGWMKNSEKGIAMVKFRLRGSERDICVAGLHLDSSKAKERRECFEEFTDEHAGHLHGCAQTFFAGDFNTRTGEKGGPAGSARLSANETERLRALDELRGDEPFGGQQLLAYINAKAQREFTEGELQFFPTYSVKPPADCDGSPHCYRADRPPSWTDRIICSGCKVFWYRALPVFRSDHLPVVGIFLL